MNRLTKAQKAELKETLDGFIEELEQRFRPDATEEELSCHIQRFFQVFSDDLENFTDWAQWWVDDEHWNKGCRNPLTARDCRFVHNAIVKCMLTLGDAFDTRKIAAEYKRGEFKNALGIKL